MRCIPTRVLNFMHEQTAEMNIEKVKQGNEGNTTKITPQKILRNLLGNQQKKNGLQSTSSVQNKNSTTFPIHFWLQKNWHCIWSVHVDIFHTPLIQLLYFTWRRKASNATTFISIAPCESLCSICISVHFHTCMQPKFHFHRQKCKKKHEILSTRKHTILPNLTLKISKLELFCSLFAGRYAIIYLFIKILQDSEKWDAKNICLPHWRTHTL